MTNEPPFEMLTDQELLEKYRELTAHLRGGTDLVPEHPLIADLEEEIQRRALPLPDWSAEVSPGDQSSDETEGGTIQSARGSTT